MRILYHHRVASKDGQYVHIDEIVSALRQLGHEVILHEPKSIGSKKFGQSSGAVRRMRSLLPGFVHELAEFSYSLLDYVRLARAIRSTRPDCIYERYNLFFPSGIWAKKRFKLPLLLEVNAPLMEERAAHGGLKLMRLADWSEKYAWCNADLVLPVTGVLARRLMAKGVAEEKIRVIANGVNLDRFPVVDDDAMRAQLGLSDKLVLGFSGFVRDWHRLDRVLDVIAENNGERWHLLLVGDGPARAALEEKAARLRIADRLTITGIVDRDRMASYVRAFDIALQPDVVDYASPLKLFEYLALGIPVIAPDKENIREILTDSKNALLFNVEDSGDFRSKLVSLCLDAPLRESIGSGGRQVLQDKELFWINNAERIAGYLDVLCQAQGYPASG